MELAREFDKKVELIGVYDPYLHYHVFNGLVGTHTDKAAKVFRFEEQNQLHEEIIDTGLAQIYQSHLEVAQQMAGSDGMEVGKTLLDGKTFQKIHDHTRKTKPWLLVLGRIGVHSDPEDADLGSTTENLLRLSDCDVLLTTRLTRPELDVRAEKSIRWTPQAEERMERVPKLVVGIARTAILRMALEQGHSVITSSLLDEAMARFMPKQAPLNKLAEAVAIGRSQEQAVAVCKSCGLTAREPDPALCTVCGATNFEILTTEMVESLVKSEGGAEVETSYDGRKLQWTKEARHAVRAVEEAYLRRRTRARIEKSARLRRLKVVTLEFAQDLIEEETGMLLAAAPSDETPPTPEADGKKLIARDAHGAPLFSEFDWTDQASARIARVPAGFMRDRTQARIEELTRQQGIRQIDLERVEAGIELGLQMMTEMVAQNEADAGQKLPAEAAPAQCPAAIKRESNSDGKPLNEVSQVNELAAVRMLLAQEEGPVEK
jgi:nucleotide-binding universal stress UspA family protein